MQRCRWRARVLWLLRCGCQRRPCPPVWQRGSWSGARPRGSGAPCRDCAGRHWRLCRVACRRADAAAARAKSGAAPPARTNLPANRNRRSAASASAQTNAGAAAPVPTASPDIGAPGVRRCASPCRDDPAIPMAAAGRIGDLCAARDRVRARAHHRAGGDDDHRGAGAKRLRRASFFTTPADGVSPGHAARAHQRGWIVGCRSQRWPAVGEAARSSVASRSSCAACSMCDPGPLSGDRISSCRMPRSAIHRAADHRPAGARVAAHGCQCPAA